MSAAKPPVVGTHISSLIPYSPGKPIDEVKRELGLTHVVKLASNENPLGPSPSALVALAEAASSVSLYPDAASHDLRAALSDHLSMPEETILCGNGSDEIIHLLGLAYLGAGDVLVQGDPSFVRYEASATLNQAECRKVPLCNWVHDLDAMADAVCSKTRLVYVANPNNPTGTVVGHAAVERFLNRLPEQVIAVFDEAYFEYVNDPRYPRSLEFIREGRNVVVLRTFSKAYGLAGLRIGYGIARPEIVDSLNRVREPFNVNLISQRAGVAALKDTDHLARTLEANREGLVRMEDAFREWGLKVTPSDANFLWVDIGRDCRPVFRALLERGVIVRTGDIFGAPNHLRITVGAPDEVTLLITELEAVLR